jgi:serine/threonine protein kinase
MKKYWRGVELRYISSGFQGNIFLWRKKNNKYSILKEYNNNKLAEKVIRILSNISHPNIINLENFYYENGKYFLEMEYYPKGNLCQRLACRKCTEKESQKWIQQLISIINYLYTIKIDHNDIKPNNIMINSNNDLILIDFGSCCINKSSPSSDYIQIQFIIDKIKCNTLIKTKL